jgi:hypothetical protein
MRFRFHCIDIYHFNICLLLSPSTSSHHLLLSPSTISHLQLLGLIFWCFFCLYMLSIVVCPGLGRKRQHLDLNWFICIKLGAWSCQLWYQCPLWVLTLLTKQDSGFIALTSIISKCVSSYLPPPPVITHLLLSPSTISHLQLLGVICWCYFCLYMLLILFDLDWEERGNILIWIDWFALNWDRGLVNCGTNVLCGCCLSWQNKIQVLLHWHLSFQNVSPLISLHLQSSPTLISFHYLPSSTPGCNMLMLFLSVCVVDCCLTWTGKKEATSWFELIDLH